MTARLDPVAGSSTAWWATSRRRIFLDAHTPDWTDPHQRGATVPDPGFEVLSQSDPARDMATLAEAGADSVVLFAKCQYGNAYYPTTVGRAHAALRGRDLFGEQLAAAHARGMRVIAYYSNMWDSAMAGAHPDWRLVPLSARGSTGRWPALCLRGPYRQYALAQVRELARRYPIDGLWSDILTAGPCVCDRCESAFRDRYGRPLPESREDPGWADLIHFSQDVLAEYLDEQRAVLREERPEAALIPNFYATTFVDAVIGLSTDHLSRADIGSSEGYTDWHGLGFPSFAASYIRAGVENRPREVLVSRFVHTWDFTLRSEAQLRFEAFTVAAHGATVSVDDQPYATGALEPEVYRRLAPVFATIEQRSPWLDGARPARFAALLASQRSRELESILGAPENPSLGEQSAQFPPSEPRSASSDLVAAVTGSYRALVEAHVPVELIDERPTALAGLGEYAVVVLPDVLSLSDAEITALTAFVEGGGGLVVTGDVAVRDARGAWTGLDPRVSALLGVTFGELGSATYPYIALGPGLAEELGAWPLPHYGRMRAFASLARDVRVLATAVDPVLETGGELYWHNNQPAPGAATGDPVIVERTIGRGRVIVSAARLGNNRARLGHASYRDLLATLVRRAAGRDPELAIEGGAASTELVVTRRGSDLIAHLVTGWPVTALDVYGAAQPAAIEDVARLARVRVRIPAAHDAWRITAGTESPVPVVDDVLDLTDVSDWETIVIRPRSTP